MVEVAGLCPQLRCPSAPLLLAFVKMQLPDDVIPAQAGIQRSVLPKVPPARE